MLAWALRSSLPDSEFVKRLVSQLLWGRRKRRRTSADREYTACQFRRSCVGKRPTFQHLQRQLQVRVAEDRLRQLDGQLRTRQARCPCFEVRAASEPPDSVRFSVHGCLEMSPTGSSSDWFASFRAVSRPFATSAVFSSPTAGASQARPWRAFAPALTQEAAHERLRTQKHAARSELDFRVCHRLIKRPSQPSHGFSLLAFVKRGLRLQDLDLSGAEQCKGGNCGPTQFCGTLTSAVASMTLPLASVAR